MSDSIIYQPRIGKVKYFCLKCKEPFCDFHSNNRKHCSIKCANESFKRPLRKCKVCRGSVKRNDHQFCSYICSEKARPRPGITSITGLYNRAQTSNPKSKPCERCGKEGQHRHHDDYLKPEKITWLCVSCHRKLHFKIGEKNNPREDSITLKKGKYYGSYISAGWPCP